MLNLNRLIKLECGIQHYAWGARQTSHDPSPPFIADLLGIDADPDTTYAELWIGAHPKCPSKALLAKGDSRPLDRLVAEFPVETLGATSGQDENPTLPFLLKILDSAQPLSIQAHPDIELARLLHQRDPEHYPDTNHKPEIAISLRGLDALCQFRNVADIRADVKRLEPLSRFFANFANTVNLDADTWLRSAYAGIFRATRPEIEAVVEELSATSEVLQAPTLQDEWFLRLNKQYPGDRGVLCAYFLNIIHLLPGQAVFLAADEPHSYLHGTIVECMASSDNVVRAGLTPKFIDADTLLDMLTYADGPPSVLDGEHEGCVRIYRGTANEFQVEIIDLDAAANPLELNSDDAVGLMLVLDGAATFAGHEFANFANRGSAWLWPACLSKVSIEPGTAGVRVIRARPNRNGG